MQEEAASAEQANELNTKLLQAVDEISKLRSDLLNANIKASALKQELQERLKVAEDTLSSKQHEIDSLKQEQEQAKADAEQHAAQGLSAQEQQAAQVAELSEQLKNSQASTEEFKQQLDQKQQVPPCGAQYCTALGLGRVP